MPTALGIYIFAGGFSIGVKRAGFDLLGHWEGSMYGVRTVKRNFGSNFPVTTNLYRWPYAKFSPGSVDFVYGNPPCAAWSVAGKSMRAGRDNWRTDGRVDCTRRLYDAFTRLQPQVWMWESVTQAYTRGRELVDALSKDAVERGYAVYHFFTSALHHRIPQPRRRFLMVASKVDLQFPRPTTLKPTVGGALGLVRFEGEVPPGYLVDPKVPHHGWAQTCPVWGVPPAGERELACMRMTLPGEDLESGWRRLYEVYKEKAKQPPAMFVNRLHPEGLGGTQTSQVMHVHPVWDRYVADSECARLSSYPDDYVFVEDEHGVARAMIAQAVLPNVGEYLGRVAMEGLQRGERVTPRIHVVSHLEGFPKTGIGPL